MMVTPSAFDIDFGQQGSTTALVQPLARVITPPEATLDDIWSPQLIPFRGAAMLPGPDFSRSTGRAIPPPLAAVLCLDGALARGACLESLRRIVSPRQSRLEMYSSERNEDPGSAPIANPNHVSSWCCPPSPPRCPRSLSPDPAGTCSGCGEFLDSRVDGRA